MANSIMLDAGVLGGLAHPRPNADLARWFEHVLASGVQVIIPEIADYEVRRSLMLEGLARSLTRLDQLKAVLTYQPINTSTMLKAAELWAKTRRQGRPTADLKALDGDVILAAQALEAGAVVATDNVGHMAALVDARRWQDLQDPARL